MEEILGLSFKGMPYFRFCFKMDRTEGKGKERKLFYNNATCKSRFLVLISFAQGNRHDKL